LQSRSSLKALGGKGPSEMMKTNSSTAIMICGHGSHDDGAVEEFNKLANHMRERLPQYNVESGFLEFATPVIRTGIKEINNFAALHPDIEFICGRDLAIDPQLLKAARDRIEECEATAATKVDRKETLLMVVGRGTNDSDANSNVHKVARMLWEGMGFGWAEVSYSGVAYPLVDEGMKHAMKLGYKRVIVFPYFLFTGILVRRIYAWADEAAAANPDVEVLNASHLNDHTQLLDCFVDRIEEALDGSNAMNCLLCKYREQVIRYEGDVGTAQVGHHQHVSATGTDGHGAHDHENPHKD
jgi:sirohydrochlorin cobaltochelatase